MNKTLNVGDTVYLLRCTHSIQNRYDTNMSWLAVPSMEIKKCHITSLHSIAQEPIIGVTPDGGDRVKDGVWCSKEDIFSSPQELVDKLFKHLNQETFHVKKEVIQER